MFFEQQKYWNRFSTVGPSCFCQELLSRTEPPLLITDAIVETPFYIVLHQMTSELFAHLNKKTSEQTTMFLNILL